jgi:hypothetical protein
MLKAKSLPDMFWGEVVATVVYVLNRSPSKGVGGRTPYEPWTRSTPSVQHLRTFGYVVHVKNTRPNLRKLKDRSKPMIFMGYEAGSMVYRAYDPVTKRVYVTRDVVFEEEASWCCGNNVVDSGFIVEYMSGDHLEVVIARHQEVPLSAPGTPVATPGARSPVGGTLGAVSPTAATPGVASTLGGQALPGHAVVHAMPPAGGEVDFDADNDNPVPLHFHIL